MILDNSNIFRLFQDISKRLVRLEKAVSCFNTPVATTPPPTPPGTVGLTITDYTYHWSEIVDGIETTFTLRYSYVPDTTHVYLDGQRLTPGVIYDYIEISPNKIKFNTPPRFASNIVVDYNKL